MNSLKLPAADESDEQSARMEKVWEKSATSAKKTERPRSQSSKRSTKKRKASTTSSAKDLQKRLEHARLQEKAAFEAKRDEILRDYPPQSKAMFGEIGFTNWSGKVYACIVLNPFQIPPGSVRNQFYQTFEKVRFR
jgi:hypothetical protein